MANLANSYKRILLGIGGGQAKTVLPHICCYMNLFKRLTIVACVWFRLQEMTRERRLPNHRAYGVLYGESRKYLIRKKRVIMGRSAKLVDIDLKTDSPSISRRHFELTWFLGRMFLKCFGKNGIFINDRHKTPGDVLYRLPVRCRIRFPNTSLELRLHCYPGPRCAKRQTFQASPEINGIDENCQRSPQHLSEVESDSKTHLVPSASCLPTTTATNHRRKQMLTSITANKPMIVNESIAQGETKVPLPSELASHQSELILSSELPPTPATTVIWDVSSETPPSFQLVSTNKPPFSFAQLIAQALASQATRRLTLSGIYQFISQNYPFYRLEDKGWQNSVRHNLSLNKHFCKAPRTPDEPGKGCYWLIDPPFEDRLISQAFRRRRFHEEQQHQRRSTRHNPQAQHSSTTITAYHAIQPTAGQQFTIIPTARWTTSIRQTSTITGNLGHSGIQTPTQSNPVLSAQLVLPIECGGNSVSQQTSQRTTNAQRKRIFLIRHPATIVASE